MRKFVELFLSFLKIGLFTFGGGYAMIPVIEREVVTRHHWVEERDFFDLLTLAQSAPGPISLNASVFVGYKMVGQLRHRLRHRGQAGGLIDHRHTDSCRGVGRAGAGDLED